MSSAGKLGPNRARLKKGTLNISTSKKTGRTYFGVELDMMLPTNTPKYILCYEPDPAVDTDGSITKLRLSQLKQLFETLVGQKVVEKALRTSLPPQWTFEDAVAVLVGTLGDDSYDKLFDVLFTHTWDSQRAKDRQCYDLLNQSCQWVAEAMGEPNWVWEPIPENDTCIRYFNREGYHTLWLPPSYIQTQLHLPYTVRKSEFGVPSEIPAIIQQEVLMFSLTHPNLMKEATYLELIAMRDLTEVQERLNRLL